VCMFSDWPKLDSSYRLQVSVRVGRNAMSASTGQAIVSERGNAPVVEAARTPLQAEYYIMSSSS
jgi:hypothetical protein